MPSVLSCVPTCNKAGLFSLSLKEAVNPFALQMRSALLGVAPRGNYTVGKHDHRSLPAFTCGH